MARRCSRSYDFQQLQRNANNVRVVYKKVLLETSWYHFDLSGFFRIAKILVFGGGSTDVLTRHYHQSAGLNLDWAILHVQLDVRSEALTLSLEFVGTHVVCPGCGAECSMKDHAAERRWRHLDAMQFQTTLIARIPRCSCKGWRQNNLSSLGGETQSLHSLV